MKKFYILMLVVVLTLPMAAIQVSASSRQVSKTDKYITYQLKGEYEVTATGGKAGTYSGEKFLPSYGDGKYIKSFNLYLPFHVGKDFQIKLVLDDGTELTKSLLPILKDHYVYFDLGAYKSKSLTIKLVTGGDRDKDVTAKITRISFVRED